MTPLPRQFYSVFFGTFLGAFELWDRKKRERLRETRRETARNNAKPITARVWWYGNIRKSPAVNQQGFSILGWEMGLEPTTTGITIRDSTN